MDKAILPLAGSWQSGQNESGFESLRSAGWWQESTRHTSNVRNRCGAVKNLRRTFTQSNGVEGQVQSMQTSRRVPRDKSKTTATTKRHDFRECRYEVCWLITWQARYRHSCGSHLSKWAFPWNRQAEESTRREQRNQKAGKWSASGQLVASSVSCEFNRLPSLILVLS